MTEMATELASRLGAKPSGKGYKTTCPCHDDKNPSLQFYDSEYKGNPYIYFRCYARCSHQDIKEFFQRDGLLPPKKEYNYSPLTFKQDYNPYPVKTSQQENKKEQTDFTNVYQDFINRLGHGDALKYCKKRFISTGFVLDYQIKSFPQEPHKLIKVIQDELIKKHGEDILKESGLFLKSYNTNTPLYCTLSKHRLIIPYIVDGKIVTLQGRLIDPPPNDKTPKNMNLKGRPIPLYNQDALQDAREGNKKICICEGVFDVLSVYELDYIEKYGHPIGIAGVNNDKDLIDLLEGLEVTIATDNDTAGDTFYRRFSQKYIQKYQTSPYRMNIPKIKGVKDINDYLMYIRKYL